MKYFSRALLLASILSSPAMAGDYAAYLAARYASHQGDNTRAAAEMQVALQADPDRTDLRYQAFILSILAERNDATELAANLTSQPLAALVTADTAATAGRWRDAELGYAVLPRSALTDMMRPLLLAWAQAAQGQTERALDTLSDGRNNPEHSDLLLSLTAALIADLAHRDGLADRLYQGIANAIPEPDARLAQILASWNARNGRDAQARQIIDGLVQRNPDLAMSKQHMLATLSTPPVPNAAAGIAETYGMIAGAAQSKRDDGQIEEVLARMARRVDPTAIAPLLLIAQIEGTRNHIPQAIAVLNKVTPDEPLYPVVQLRIAALKARNGETDQAINLLHALSSRYSDRPEPMSSLGDIYTGQNKFGAAVDAYSQAINRLSPPNHNDWALFYARGAAYERLHDWTRAMGDMQHALALSPEQPFVLNFVGFSMADRNTNLSEARSMIERALKQRPDDGAIIDSLGWVKLRQGDASGALDDLEHAATLNPTDPTIMGHLGDAYWQLGRHTEAENQWRRALILNPDETEQARIQTRLNEALAAQAAAK